MCLIAFLVGCSRGVPAPPRAAAKGPLRVHAQNPRYFDDGTGKAIYLTGSHTWISLQDGWTDDPPREFDFNAYLDFLGTYNHNFIRLWRCEFAKYRYKGDGEYRYCQPHPWARTGPGNALDGKPKFDLTKFDAAHFDRLRSRIKAARDRGIYVGVMLFEGHGLVEAEEGWFAHPLNAANNINGIDGDSNRDGRGIETQTLNAPPAMVVQEAYVRKVIDTLNDLDNVLYEIGNECHKDSDPWQRHMIHFIQREESTKPKQHLVMYSAPVYTHGEQMWQSSAEVVSPGRKWVGESVPLCDDPPVNDGRKIVILDTDHLWGCGGYPQWVFKAFMRGYHPIYMDSYTRNNPFCPKPDPEIRRYMGYTLRFAERMNMAKVQPRNELASTGYCLADIGREYLVYVPSGGSVTVDLSAARGHLSVEWFDPAKDSTERGEPVGGGQSLTLRAPFRGEAVVYVVAVDAVTTTSKQ